MTTKSGCIEEPNLGNAIYIIGNGVIAKALAVALTLDGKSVTILRGSVDEQPTSCQRIQVTSQSGVVEAAVNISSISNYETLEGLVLLTSKSFGNDQLASKLLTRARHTPVVFLQNGLHIEKSFIEREFTNLYRCVLLATSESVGDNEVRFRLVAPSPVGSINGSEDVLKSIVDQVSTSLFPFQAVSDIQPIVWKKVISNCVFNSICPLLETDNGIFGRNDSALALGKAVIGECLTVARHYGVQLTEAEVLQNVLMISKLSDGQKISTYQDILQKRPTEIDALNFAVADAARQAGPISVPVTALLGELIRLKSDVTRSNETS